jgi:acyl-CoA thioester hydrolase
MDRVKVDIKNLACFETIFQVSIGDINYGGHLSNDAILRIVHEARIQFLEKHSMSEMNIGNGGIIMIDAAIQYMSEAFRGEQLKIEISFGEITKSGFDLFYHLLSLKSNKTVAKIKTGLLFFDYEKHKITSVSEEVIGKLKGIGQ